MKPLFIIILLLINLSNSQGLFAQIDADTSQRIEKAIIKDNYFYFYEGNQEKKFIGINRNIRGGNNAFLRIVPLNALSHPIYNDLVVHSSYSKEYDFSFCWDILAPYTYVIGTSGGYHKEGDRYSYQKAPSVSLLRIPIIKKDTNYLISEYDNYLKKIHSQYPNTDDSFRAQLKDQENAVTDRNRQGLYTIENLIQFWVENMPSEFWLLPPNPFSFDFFMVENNRAEFFIRDFKGFSHWNYQYPDVNQSSTVKNWNEKITYYADSTKQLSKSDSLRIYYWGQNKVTFDHQYLPRKILYSSIGDTELLKGNFKVYKQGDNRFIVNLKYGGIYWLAPSSIIKIGQIDLAGYKKRLFGKLLFIEDRDNEELIFFSNVRKLNADTPFPKIKIIIDEIEFKQKFKFLLQHENGIFE